MLDQRDMSWVFAPLDKVPRRTMARMAERLRKSKDGGEKAIGAFLDRVMAHQDGKTGKSRPVVNARDPRFSSLKDLRD